MKVTIDGNTHLVLKDTKNGVSTFSEVYYNHETGNYIPAPADATPEEVAAIYSATNG